MFPIALVTSITLTGVLIYLGAATFLLLFILKQKSKQVELSFLGFRQIHTAFLAYIFAFTLTKVINSGFQDGINICLRFCQDYFVFIWVLLFIANSSKNQKIVKYAILVASLISVFYGVMQLLHLDLFHRQVDIARLSGFHKNPYSYGGQLIVLFFFLLTFFRSFTNKVLEVLILGLTFTCLLNTSERAVIFGVIAGVVLYYTLPKVKNLELSKLLVVFLLPALITYFINEKVIKRIKRAVVPQQGMKPNIRFRLWGIAFTIWKRNLLFGMGAFPKVYHGLKVLTHAHNTYLQILVVNGIVGLLAFVNLFFSISKVLIRDLKNNSYASCLLSIFLAFFIEGIFEYFWGDSEVRYTLLYFMGFVVGLSLDSNLKEYKK